MANVADHHGPVRRGIEWVGRGLEAAWRSAVRFYSGIGPTLGRLPGGASIASGYHRTIIVLRRALPKGLFARSLIIIIAPIVVLQAVVAFVFMERHYAQVTQNLAAATTRDIAAMIELVSLFPEDGNRERVITIGAEQLNLDVALLPGAELPPPSTRPFFSPLDQALTQLITDQIGLPFWIDTLGQSDLIEVRIQLDGQIMQVLARRSQAYASNSDIFILWMVGTSLVLVTIAILFLRNQIRPIQRLADAAERFGKGRPSPGFIPRGAREVRRASLAFIRMRERIIRQMEQRTEMLAGVSHDLRTILTRFRLQLELMSESDGSDELRRDVDDMQQMLEDYLAFASGDSAEQPQQTNVPALLRREAEYHSGEDVLVSHSGDAMATLRPLAFRRCVGNLIANAVRHADRIAVRGESANGFLTVTVDDNGPGIPEGQREAVFKPFYRLDAARNIEDSGTGLGLPIARDIARAHGGDISLSQSPLGGLRATVRIPG